jgi:hypothetical protein
MSLAKRPRRYYLLRYFFAQDDGEPVTAAVWRAKQLEQVATALPADFPARAQLVAAFYETLEDVDGADVDELAHRVGLQRSTARAVIAAAEAAL